MYTFCFTPTAYRKGSALIVFSWFIDSSTDTFNPFVALGRSWYSMKMRNSQLCAVHGRHGSRQNMPSLVACKMLHVRPANDRALILLYRDIATSTAWIRIRE